MENYDNIKKQKLILKHDEGAYLAFIDENQAYHEYNFSKEDVFIDLREIVTSCFEPLDGDEIGPLTCGCGVPGCAGFYHFHSEIIGNEIIWDVNHGDDLFRFDRNQYIEEVKTRLEEIKKLCEKSGRNGIEYFPAGGFYIGLKDINELLSNLICRG